MADLKFKDGQFKILQIADVQDGKKISVDTINLINRALDIEKPNLVCFSGDQIWGYTNFKGNKEAVEKALNDITKPVVDRGIPFTVCFGNHDRQVGVSNEEQFKMYEKMRGFIGKSEQGIDGVGNHVLEVKNGEKTEWLIYFIDSHSNLKVGYDNVHENQIEWYKNVRDEYEEKCGGVVPSIVIQHIPVPEVMELLLEVKKSTKGAQQGFRNHAGKWYILNKDMVNADGFMKESPADPMENSGEFDAMAEKGDVRGIYFGHDHNNSFNGKVRGIDLGYTQGAGFHVYGPGLDRGVRVITLKENGRFETHDLRYRNIVGTKVKEKLYFGVLQIMPTNLYDALHRGIKIVAVILAVAVVIALLAYLL